MKQTHSSIQDASNLLFGALLVLIIVMACCGCSTQRGGCQMTRGYIGYGNR